MAGLPPIALGMTGLAFACFINALPLLGIHAKPIRPEAPDPAKTLGIIASFSGFLTLFCHALWFVIGAPLGVVPPASNIQLLFSTVPAMYALVWLGLALCQWFGWDLRPVGTAAAFVGFKQIWEMGVYAYLVTGVIKRPFGLHDVLIEIALLSYAVAVFGFCALVYGKFPPKAQGWILIWAGIMTLYLLYWPGGILPV